jgi:hypothetical protein
VASRARTTRRRTHLKIGEAEENTSDFSWLSGTVVELRSPELITATNRNRPEFCQI